MENHGMYEQCTRCPLISHYKEQLINLEMISEKNAQSYCNRISSIIQSCCSKEIPELTIEDVVTG